MENPHQFAQPHVGLSPDVAKFIAMSRAVDGIRDYDMRLTGSAGPHALAAEATARNLFKARKATSADASNHGEAGVL